MKAYEFEEQGAIPNEVYLLERFGPLLSGRPLWQALGYHSAQAFQKAARRGVLPVHTFRIEYRRGLFAYSAEVARWLDLVGCQACQIAAAEVTS